MVKIEITAAKPSYVFKAYREFESLSVFSFVISDRELDII